MTKISDTQRAILIAAARREDGAIRLPARVKGGAAAKTIQSLIKAGLITEKPFTITADGRAAIGARVVARGRAAASLANAAPRTDTKQAQVVAMLRGAGGATVEEIAAATGWQRHTVRGAIAGALKKKLGLDVISEKIEGRGRVYRIAA
jgi:DNA-binding MarR family transcriptional regulator